MAVAASRARDAENNPTYNVIGVDQNTDLGLDRVRALNSGQFPFSSSDQSLTSAAYQGHKAGNLSATIDDAIYSTADIIIVDIALDIPFQDEEPNLDLEGFKSAIQTIAQRVSPGALVLVETTVPPGTCENVVVPILHKELKERGLRRDDVYLAHSYERVMPGSDYLASITNFWRVYAGATEKSAQKCEDFLQTLIDVEAFPLTRLSSMTASESAKVLENTYRAVNIAFIDEWTKYAEVADIDLFEVINAIKIRPTHSNMMYPGLGVGGYCLTKDPAFTPAAVREFLEDDDLDFPFSRLALKTNQAMPQHAVLQLRQLLGGCISGKRVLVLGVSYREDIGDTRYSAVETFVKNLEQEGAVVTPYDPYVLFWPEMNLELPKQIPDPKEFDAIVISVRHENFIKFDFVNWLIDARPVILDAVDLLDAKVRAEIRARGIRMTSLGRGVSH